MKHVSMFMLTILLTATLGGCIGGKKGGTDDGNTNVGDLDETAFYDDVLADNGFRVNQTLTNVATPLAGGDNGSAVLGLGVDLQANDSSESTDKATFLIDAIQNLGVPDNASDPNATVPQLRVTAKLVSMTTAAAMGASADLQGGVAHNQQINGGTGFGFPEFPETKSYLTITGLCRVKIDTETQPDLHLVFVYVTRGLRDREGNLLAVPDDGDLEVHVFFPGSTIAGNPAFPGVEEGWFYTYYENVRLRQMTPDEKAVVGSDLIAPTAANILPIASGKVLVNGAPATSGTLSPTKPFELVLDGTNSTDPDGKVEAYSWTVHNLNASNLYEAANKTTGALARVNLTQPGPKLIDLRIIDSRGGIGNVTIPFTLHYKNNLAGAFTVPGQAVGGQTTCQLALNCLANFMTIDPGATKVVVASPTSGANTQCVNRHINLRAPGVAADATPTATSATNAALTYQPAGGVKPLGRWSIEFWCEAHAGGWSYTSTVDVTYKTAP